MSFSNQLRAFERSWIRSLLRLLTRRLGNLPEGNEEEGLAEGRAVLAARAPYAGPRLAMVGPLPPATTGVAAFTAAFFHGAGWRTDFFAPGDLGEFRRAWPGATTLPLEGLGRLEPLGAYDLAMLQAGNSPHHVPTLQAFHRAADPTGRKAVYLHDAQLVRLWAAWCGRNPFRLRRLYREQYPDRVFSLTDLFMPQDAGSEVPRGIRPLLALARPQVLLVNNAFCAQLVDKDLEGWEGVRPEIRQLFHPIPPPPEGVGAAPRTRRVGHFGAIGEDKRIDVLVQAMRLLRDRKPATLVLAGFNVGRYARRHRLGRFPWIEIHDSPEDDRLMQLMESADVGIQMRHRSHGESSGVVTQLLSLGRPVIVSRTGGFAELGEAVTMVRPDAGPEEVASALEAALDTPRERALAEVLRSQSLEAFHAAILSLLREEGRRP